MTSRHFLDTFADLNVDNVSAEAVLDKGLQDLMDMCDIIEDKFREASDDYQNKMQE